MLGEFSFPTATTPTTPAPTTPAPAAATINFVKNIVGTRIYQRITHTELDCWTFQDFASRGMIESIKDQEFIHLNFDFDFKTSSDPLLEPIFQELQKLSEVFGTYYCEGY